MAKPTFLPRWATDVLAKVTTPTSGKQDLGWSPTNEKPPAQYLNWLFNGIYQWLLFFTSERRRCVAAIAGVPVLGTGSFSDATGVFENVDAADQFEIPIEVNEGEQIAHAYLSCDPSSGGTITFQIVGMQMGTNVEVVSNTATSTGATPQIIVLTPSVPANFVATAANCNFKLRVTFTGTLNQVHSGAFGIKLL